MTPSRTPWASNPPTAWPRRCGSDASVASDWQKRRRAVGDARFVGQIGVLGWIIVTPTLIGLFVGRWLDRQLRHRHLLERASAAARRRDSASGRPGDGCISNDALLVPRCRSRPSDAVVRLAAGGRAARLASFLDAALERPMPADRPALAVGRWCCRFCALPRWLGCWRSSRGRSARCRCSPRRSACSPPGTVALRSGAAAMIQSPLTAKVVFTRRPGRRSPSRSS